MAFATPSPFTIRNSLSLFMAAFAFNYIRSPERALPIISTDFKQEYDYVIIGSGSAGSTLANRLSEDPDVTVLVIEAGMREHVFHEVPLANYELMGGAYDWNFLTEPQKFCCSALQERRSYWPRGKAVGGSSSINFNLYIRGNHRDYDHWETLGAKGWAWKDIFPYFLKAEDNTDGPEAAAPGYHGKGGPLSVSQSPYRTIIGDAFMEAGRLLGYKSIDSNGPSQTGFTRHQGTLRNGTRCSASRAYLVPASRRRNVDILDKALATKILFDDKKRARSVVFERDNQVHQVRARREVLLCAGTMKSPQLLMLSGIGPRKELEKFGIPVIADVPGVGENLHEHIAAGGLDYTVNVNETIGVPSVVSYGNANNVELVYYNGTGPLTLTGGCEAMGFVNTKYSDPSGEYPDIQFLFFPLSAGSYPGLGDNVLRVTSEVFKKYYEPYLDTDAFSMYPVLLRPKTRGTIRLRSTNPRDQPIIEPNFLKDRHDLDVLIESVKISIQIGDSEPMRKIGAKRFEYPVPGCEQYSMWSDPYIECHVRALTIAIYHPGGTCKMGSLRDPMTVVDNEARVRGVRGLRVIDCSIMPQVVSGNTNAPTIAMAEKLADHIKGRTPLKAPF